MVEINQTLNDTTILDTVMGLEQITYRGFKCFPGATEVFNWESLINELDGLDYSKKILIEWDLNSF